HTRSYGDWSSDVCSSDLSAASGGGGVFSRWAIGSGAGGAAGLYAMGAKSACTGADLFVLDDAERDSGECGCCPWSDGGAGICDRSEERRVGKGGRWGGSR